MATQDTLLFAARPDYQHDAVTVLDQVVAGPGGKGLVSAGAIARSGAEALPLALVGPESPLRRAIPPGSSDRFICPLLERDTRTWMTVSRDQHVVTMVDVGPLSDETKLKGLVRRFLDEIDALYVAVEQLSVMSALIAVLREADKLPVAVNLSRPLLDTFENQGTDLLGELVSASQIAICNEIEEPLALKLLGLAGWHGAGVGPLREIVVTTGANGGRVSLSPFDSWEEFDAVPVSDPVSVVGAGDTFGGAYVVARMLDEVSEIESCERGAELAAECLRHPTALLPPT